MTYSRNQIWDSDPHDFKLRTWHPSGERRTVGGTLKPPPVPIDYSNIDYSYTGATIPDSKPPPATRRNRTPVVTWVKNRLFN